MKKALIAWVLSAGLATAGCVHVEHHKEGRVPDRAWCLDHPNQCAGWCQDHPGECRTHDDYTWCNAHPNECEGWCRDHPGRCER